MVRIQLKFELVANIVVSFVKRDFFAVFQTKIVNCLGRIDNYRWRGGKAGGEDRECEV
jgi:hypothetical protein